MDGNDGVEVLPVESGSAGSPCEKPNHETGAPAADNHLELPQALQELLRRLNGSLGAEPVVELPYLRAEEYGDFFSPEGRECRRRTEVRLMVLEALGQCKTLNNFHCGRMRGCNLSAPEWEALTIPMQTNAQLDSIEITSHESAEEDALMGPYLQNLIRHSLKLQSLSLGNPFLAVSRLTAKFAAEVAIALQPKLHHRLKSMWFNLRGAEASLILPVAEIISYAPKLESLYFDGVGSLDVDGKEALSTALKGFPRLIHLEISEIQEEMVDVLVEVYNRSCSDSILEHLSLTNDVRGLTAQAFTLLICCNVTSIYIQMDDLGSDSEKGFHYFSLDQWQTMGRTLLHPPTLLQLDISLEVRDWPKRKMEAIGTGLVELWNASKNSPLLHLKVLIGGHSGLKVEHPAAVCRKLVFLQRAMDSTYLQSLHLYNFDVETTYFRSFVDKLASNPSIDELDIFDCSSSSEDGWSNLFSHLRHNTSIRVLILHNCSDLNDGNFRDMMDLLQVNFILERIDVSRTGWETDGKGALILEAMARNKKQAGYFSVLGQAKLTFDGAKAGRVFLCGEPYAGKTTLKMTMMECMLKKSNSESVVAVWKEKFGKWVQKWKTKRTQGIEVELLCENQSSIISIWDLAGQNIFRALHHLLFPRISQACIFVFVFNPFEGEGKNRMPKSKMQDVFAQELKSWLRFITSNTQITGRILPQVLVILTHKDKLERSKWSLHLMIMELEKTMMKLQLQYKDVVNLCPPIHGSSAHLIYQVNAKVEKDVHPITDLVLSFMKEELERKSSVVPRACSELVSHLLRRTEGVQLSPLWPCEEFYDFCSKRSSSLKEFKSTSKEGRSVLHAVGSYMHDLGAICMTPSAITSSYDILMRNPKMSVVVDLNWLTQNLLGKIISCGHGFDMHLGTSTSYQSYHDGFVDPEKLFHLVEEVLQQNISKSNTEREMIKELLFELDLCYSIESREGVSRYFMPILFGGKEDIVSLDNVHWSSQGSGYFGFRVQCLDEERTSFSPAFYPRFQIQLRKQMGALGVVDENFIFSRCYAEIRTHGCIIVVEIDESTENHIDIMVQFSKDQIRDWYMDFVQEHVVKDLIQFCASGKGCPGVQLVVSVLRTRCVERLTPRKLRTSVQAVLVEELKRQFQNDVEKHIGEGEVESKSLFGYKHSWPEISASSVQAGGYTLPQEFQEAHTLLSSKEVQAGGYTLPQEFQEAQTLLSSKEVTEVLLAVKKNHEDLWQNLQELRQVSNRLKDPSIQLDLALHRPVAEVHISFDDSSNNTEEECESLTSLTSRPSFKTRDDVTVGEKLILRGMVHLQKNILAHLEQVKVVLGNFKSSVDDMCLQMSHVTSKVDNIIGCKKSKEDHKYPRRPYFTSKDVSITQKVKGAVLFGEAVRLHLMCEARHQTHFVENQVGLELDIEKDDQFSKSMRTLSIVSLHMIWILLKVGTQVTAGLGSAIPDISNLMRGVSIAVSASGNLLLDRMKLELDKDLSLLKDHDSVEEAWFHFRHYLTPNLTADKCASLFKLQLVRYRNSDDPYAWLCESCALSGRRNFLLEKS